MEEQEEDEDLLDFLVVSAITNTCIDDFEDDDEDDAEAQQVCNQPNVLCRKRCRRSRRKVMWTNEDGTQHPFTAKHSLWYNIYVAATSSQMFMMTPSTTSFRSDFVCHIRSSLSL